jgi:hypothetical protein
MVYLIYIVFFFAFGFCLGWMYVKVKLHTLDDYNQMYSHLTCEIVSRMTMAMRSLCMEQEDIDRVIHRMGCKVMPAAVPRPPAPPIKQRDFDKDPYTMDEVIRRLTPHDDQGGEWYCTSRQPKIAWRIDAVNEDGTIRRKLVHDMREHTISKAPCPQQPENIRTLAENIIKFNFRFLKDFDMSEWD